MSGLESKAREVSHSSCAVLYQSYHHISQLKLDIAEMKSLVETATRSKVRDLLSVTVREN